MARLRAVWPQRCQRRRSCASVAVNAEILKEALTGSKSVHCMGAVLLEIFSFQLAISG